MTDNGSSFRSDRYARALRRLKIKHLRTKPYTPKTNGKAERFVQTSLRESAYAQAYNTSEERAAELPIWLHRYNWHRPHGGNGAKPPMSRLMLTEDNVLRLHSLRPSKPARPWCKLQKRPSPVRPLAHWQSTARVLWQPKGVGAWRPFALHVSVIDFAMCKRASDIMEWSVHRRPCTSL